MKGWKTIVIAVLVAVLGVLQQVGWVDVIGQQWGGLVLTGIGGVMALLRAITNTPMGTSTPKA